MHSDPKGGAGAFPVSVKKITRRGAVLQALGSELEFTLPLELLPGSLSAGESLGLQISNTEAVDRDEKARRLLEEIIN